MHARLSWFRILGDLVHFLCLGLRSRASLAAENLFLRKQLAFYQERTVKPRRADNPTRLTLVLLSRWFKLARCFARWSCIAWWCPNFAFPTVRLSSLLLRP